MRSMITIVLSCFCSLVQAQSVGDRQEIIRSMLKERVNSMRSIQRYTILLDSVTILPDPEHIKYWAYGVRSFSDGDTSGLSSAFVLSRIGLGYLKGKQEGVYLEENAPPVAMVAPRQFYYIDRSSITTPVIFDKGRSAIVEMTDGCTFSAYYFKKEDGQWKFRKDLGGTICCYTILPTAKQP